MKYPTQECKFPQGAIDCARIIREYDSKRKLFPENAIEATKILIRHSEKPLEKRL